MKNLGYVLGPMFIAAGIFFIWLQWYVNKAS